MQHIIDKLKADAKQKQRAAVDRQTQISVTSYLKALDDVQVELAAEMAAILAEAEAKKEAAAAKKQAAADKSPTDKAKSDKDKQPELK